MTDYINRAEGGEEANYWNPVSSILAAAVLLLLVVFAGVALRGTQENTAQKTNPPAQVNTEAEAALKEREKALDAREKALTDQQAAINEIAGIRTVIIEELKNKLLELKLPVEINELTGSVRFTESVLFGVGNDQLNGDGQNYLKTFLPVYLEVLLSSKNIEYLDQIVIEGHADIDGSYWSNLFLSENRANSVMNYLLSQKLIMMPDGTPAEKYFTVSARSHNVPVMVNGVTDRNQSRRVEFVFRLKDDEILAKMQDLSKGEQ